MNELYVPYYYAKHNMLITMFNILEQSNDKQRWLNVTLHTLSKLISFKPSAKS